MTRREWFASIGRVLVTGAGVTGLTHLASRDPEICVSQGICRGCRVVGQCGLPQALSYKQVTGQGPTQQEGSNER